MRPRRERRLKWNKVNYRDLLHTKLPRKACKPTTRKSTAKQPQEKLFSVDIIEKEASKVRVHYIGFSSEYDEWKDAGKLK